VISQERSSLNAVCPGTATAWVSGPASFGGRSSASDAHSTDAYCTGTLIRCTTTGNTRPLNLDGATLTGCRITNTTTGQDCVRLLDNDSVITDSTLIVFQGGTGIPINAATAKNVTASNCRMNNATNDPNGLGDNVTNLAATPNNTVSDAIE